MLDRVTRMLVGITIGAWVARHLGPQDFGQLAYVIAFIALFQTLNSLGLDLIVAREVPRNPEEAHALLGTCLRLRLAAGSASWLLAVVSMYILRPGDSTALQLVSILATCLIFQPADLIDAWFQSQSQSRRSTLPRIIAYLLAALIRVLMINASAPLWTFAAAYVAEAIVAAALLWLAYRQHPTASKWSWSFSLARRTLVQGYPLLVSSISIILYMRVDQILIRSLAGDYELGLYSSILPFSQAWHFIATTVCASAMPYLVRLHASDPKLFTNKFEQLFCVLAWIAISLSIGISLASNQIVQIFLGEKYSGASNILSVHIYTNVPIFLGVAQMTYLTIASKTKAILIQTVAGLIASLVLNMILIPRLGALGSAIASTSAQIISAVLCNAAFDRKLFLMQVTSPFRANKILFGATS